MTPLTATLTSAFWPTPTSGAVTVLDLMFQGSQVTAVYQVPETSAIYVARLSVYDPSGKITA